MHQEVTHHPSCDWFVSRTCTCGLKALRDSVPDDIRAAGWAVAVHNDYRLAGVAHTFWLFTRGDRCIKGESLTDAEALNQIRAALGL